MDTAKVSEILNPTAASRRDFLKLAAAAGAGALVGGQAFPRTAHAATDDPSSILSVALTGEFLAVTFLTNALQPANAAALGLSSNEMTTLQAMLAAEAIHVRALQSYGAVPTAPFTNAFGTFSFPSGGMTFTDRPTFANTAVLLETAFVAAYMAAAGDFAANAREDLARATYQIGAVEAEHRAIARVLGGFVPYADVAFELDLFRNVAAAATFLTNQGFLSPTAGNSFPYFDVNTTNAISSYSSLLLGPTS